MSAKTSLIDLLAEEIKDLYSAEKQLVKAIPKMVSGATDPELKSALVSHLNETKEQVTRLEAAAELLGVKPSGKTCKGMEGVIEEGAEALKENGPATLLDLNLIGAASRVEHYEMAGYMTAISLAEQLGEEKVVELLSESLSEENSAEEKLRDMAAILLEAAESEAGVENEKVESKSKKKAMSA